MFEKKKKEKTETSASRRLGSEKPDPGRRPGAPCSIPRFRGGGGGRRAAQIIRVCSARVVRSPSARRDGLDVKCFSQSDEFVFDYKKKIIQKITIITEIVRT